MSGRLEFLRKSIAEADAMRLFEKHAEEAMRLTIELGFDDEDLKHLFDDRNETDLIYRLSCLWPNVEKEREFLASLGSENSLYMHGMLATTYRGYMPGKTADKIARRCRKRVAGEK